ncbi:autophagy-related protein 16 isoform X1 [Drosophila guanche]|uniref:Blast:Autophagy-related protein 16 n=2 Tax=Drosophila guanche TaxID=7266 RepID=A0A3B0K765_DROGU|nr:autophagy-related protein 16 isoform X1 [Drosophila guanche]XP_034140650.1 autophagy-related protein 16 isoform X1 [Drosophila guanche]SPP89955.1 blast:Autophagy-related protein 16 [Drosophila guanche]
MSTEEHVWRAHVVKCLRERNRKECENFKEIIEQNNRLIDHVAQLKSDNLKLSVENEQLRSAMSTGGTGSHVAIATLEKKLLSQQEELTELHKRKGENSQLIVDLNMKVEQQRIIMSEREHSLAEQQTHNNRLRAEVHLLHSSLEELKKLNNTLLDEHTALQLAFSSLEDKMRGIQDENRCLLERLMRYKSKDADKLNEENESIIRKRLPSIFRKRSAKLKRDLEDAVREPSASINSVPTAGITSLHRNSTSPAQFIGGIIADDDFDEAAINGAMEAIGLDDTEYINARFTAGEVCETTRASIDALKATGYLGQANPTKILLKFEAHENESHAVRWSPVERMVATGGADRKVKLWDIGKNSTEPRAVLSGSSAGINSVDFDSTGAYILGTSNDYGARVWTVIDNRLRHTLTGHSGKVMAAKYVQEPIKVVTGSHDRTLKIWDLRSIACIETKFAGSSCNDLVTTDSLGSTIISGHYDKKIRFWDIRTEKQADDVLMPAKITSLDLSKDCNYLICSVRDDTIKLLDLRKNQVISTFTNEHFKISCDFARASFNSSGLKIACGSADGAIYIWNVNGFLETTLKGHSTAVNAVSWSPNSNLLASVGKSKRCIIYSDS